MDIGSLLLGLALLLVIAFIVARPLLEKTVVREQGASPADQLLASRERVLTELRDLDFDQAMSKINAVDYAAQRAQLVAEGVAILKQLDALGLAAGQPDGALPAASNGAPGDEIEAAVAQLRARRAASARTAPIPASSNVDVEIEASVAARRASGGGWPAPNRPAAAQKLAGAEKSACAQCGTEVLPDDRFCPKCGSPLTIACGNCGRVARMGDQFCAHCGQTLSAPAAGLRSAKVQS